MNETETIGEGSENGNQVPFEYFRFMVDWLLRTRRRYPEMSFGLVLVEFYPHETIGQAFGAQEAMRKLLRFADALSCELRLTDLTTRDLTSFWVLLPFTQPGDAIFGKLARVVEEARLDGLDVAETRMLGYAIQDEDFLIDEHIDGAALLQRVRAGAPGGDWVSVASGS
jgi:hypothetical protein